jgi:CheY-like chemotaxis protein
MSKKDILLVEDSKDIQALLMNVLKSSGYNVQTVLNGKEALEVLSKNSSLPSVIMLDLMMPVMDGYEFRMQQLLDPKLSQIPVLVMTAESAAHDKVKGLKAQAFLKKPFENIEAILETIRKLVEK